ncbi:MAG TPA: hypothetical protein VLL76_03350, partial [Candidatus Omnitrophota bacterium]|nr:hypothetical protein [Candidatus Omnitrophota bacterium]
GFAVTMGMAEQRDDGLSGATERRAMLGEATKRLRDGTVLGVQVGSLSEAEGPLASSAGGAFGFDGDADTVFTGLFAATPLSSQATLFGRWGQGFTDGDALNGGLWRGGDTIRSESFALGTTLRQDTGTWSFTASRPLRVTSGHAVLGVPVGRAMDGSVLYRDASVDLAPSGAQTDLELSWSATLADNQRLVLGGMLTLQPGHDADAGPAFAAGAKYRFRW